MKVTSCSLLKNLGDGVFQDEQGCTVHLRDGSLESEGSEGVSIQAFDAAFLAT